MMKETVVRELIPKELVPSLSFSKNEVLRNPKEKAVLKKRLTRACRIGNMEQGKVRITFLTQDGWKGVYTTIWGVTDRHVSLKNGASIPISAIGSVGIG